MSETTTNPPDELALLKERAKLLGINAGNMGLDRLRAAVSAAQNESATEEEAAPKSQRQVEQDIRNSLRKEKMALVRCQIYNLNPAKRDLRGEVITVGNRFLGTVRKMIPFGEATDNGYHIERVLFDDLKRRKFQQVTTTRKNGKIEVKTRMVPEYNLVELPPLTAAELKELEINQAAANRLNDEG